MGKSGFGVSGRTHREQGWQETRGVTGSGDQTPIPGGADAPRDCAAAAAAGGRVQTAVAR